MRSFEPHLRRCMSAAVRRVTQHELSAQPRRFGLRHCCSLQSIQGPVSEQPGSFLHSSKRISGLDMKC